MTSLTEMLNNSLDEAIEGRARVLQTDTGKAVKAAFEKPEVKEVIIIRYDDTDRAEELEKDSTVYGPISTKDGKLYGIKK